MKVWRNARLLTLSDPSIVPIENAVIMVESGRIVYAGGADGAPQMPAGCLQIDLEGRLATPALLDCHTHVVHGGDRSVEFEMRLDGSSYVAIAESGGGIASTVRATRALSLEQLVNQALPRVDALLAEGVATVEIKSGYGLTIEAELQMLRAARQLAVRRPVRILTSYLAAHAVPSEYKGHNESYIEEVVLPGLRLGNAEGLIDAVDGFCEGIAFSPDEIRRVFEEATRLGLPVKLHAEQLSHLGGAQLASRFGALSADHLEYIEDADAAAMAAAETVAVLLPGAFYALRETRRPDVEALRRHGVQIAVATDCNPGTSPLTSVLMAMNMAATLFGLTVAECLLGTTRHAARALGILGETGTLEPGKSADIAIWNCERPAELVYRISFNPLQERIFKGNSI